MTAAQNKDLDIAINSFLDLVASRLLLKPGQKALEWLIRRFRAHEYNTEHLLLVFLSYHSTPLFVNLLSILPARLPPSFKFLKPYVAALTNPPIHAIIYSATNNTSFFLAFNRQVLGAAKAKFVSSELVRFWTVLVSQAVDGMLTTAQSGISTIRKERMESVLLQIIPILDEVFATQGNPEMEVGACMIITIIAARGDISDNVKARFMEAISASWNQTTVDARLVSLVALNQDAVPKRLPKKVAKRLLSTTDLLERLTTISASYRAANLVIATFNYCLSRLNKPDCEQEIEFVSKSLQGGLIEGKALGKSLQILLTKIASLTAEEANALQFNGNSKKQLSDVFGRNDGSPLSVAIQALQIETEIAAVEAVLSINIHREVNSADEMDLDVPSESQHQSVELDLSELSQLSSPSKSFLATADSAVFDKLARLFSVAVKQSSLDALLNHHLFKQSAATKGDTLYGSFLVRLGSSSNQSPKIRAHAMALLCKLVSTLQTAGQDAQLLTPYLVIALQDESSHVRRHAAGALLELSNPTKVGSKVWGSLSLYDEEPPTISLAHDQLTVLLKDTLVPRLQEFVTDSSAVSQVLINFSTTKSKSAKHNKTAIYDFFGTHAALTSLIGPKVQLFELLVQFGKPAVATLSTFGLQGLQQWVGLAEKDSKKLCSSQGLVLNDVNLSLVKTVVPASSEGLEYLLALISGPEGRFDIVQPSHQRLTEIWKAIPAETRSIFLSGLVEMSLKDPKAGQKLRDASNQTLRNLPLEIDDLVSLLKSLPDTASLSSSSVIKRKRLSSGQSSTVERIPKETLEALRRYTRVLEIVESSSSPHGKDHAILLKSLFHVLGELQNFGIQTESSMVYLKTLTINALLDVVNRLKDTKDYPEQLSTVRTDLVVDTIANTPNIQLQQACLLLISGLATWLPEVVLHSVMPIFTLMGSSVLRQGDDYSAHVIDQTVSQVVPPLVASLRARSKEVLSGLSDILVSFTVAFEHIPSHRRLSLFTHIVNALGAEECLFAVVCMIRNRYPTDFGARQFAADLTDSFSPQIALKVCVYFLLKYKHC
jgi:U3 small nucleolar RNA-associated protein 10